MKATTYRLHRQSGQAIIRLNLGNGVTRDMLLGKYNSAESKREYGRIVAELRAGSPWARSIEQTMCGSIGRACTKRPTAGRPARSRSCQKLARFSPRSLPSPVA